MDSYSEKTSCQMICLATVTAIAALATWLTHKVEKRSKSMTATLTDLKLAVEDLRNTSANLAESVTALLNKIDAGQDFTEDVASLRETLETLKAVDAKVDTAVDGPAEPPVE